MKAEQCSSARPIPLAETILRGPLQSMGTEAEMAQMIPLPPSSHALGGFSVGNLGLCAWTSSALSFHRAEQKNR